MLSPRAFACKRRVIALPYTHQAHGQGVLLTAYYTLDVGANDRDIVCLNRPGLAPGA